MKITDEMAIKACEAYYKCFKLDGKLNPLAMRVALEAALGEEKEKKEKAFNVYDRHVGFVITRDGKRYFEGLDKGAIKWNQ